MSNLTYTPGAVATVGDLEVGDAIFLRTKATLGQPTPVAPAIVSALEPASDGRVLVTVYAANGSPATPRPLGHLPISREFRRAVQG